MIPEVKIPKSPQKNSYTYKSMLYYWAPGNSILRWAWFRQTAESIFVHAEMHAVKNMAKIFQNH